MKFYSVFWFAFLAGFSVENNSVCAAEARYDVCLERKPKIAVIGLGFAGLELSKWSRTCGIFFTFLVDLLCKEGKFEVIGIEGRDRLGGRVYTNAEGDEEGAAWIHGTDMKVGDRIEVNPVFEKAESLGCQYYATNRMKGVNSDYTRPLQCSDDLWDQMWQSLDHIKTSKESVDNAFLPAQTSIYEYIRSHFTEVFSGIPENEVDAVIKAVREWQSYYAGNWDDLSVGSMAVDREYQGEQYIIKNGGYAQLIKKYESDIEANGGKIIDKTIVKKIKRRKDGKVEIRCRGESCPVIVDCAVVTVSLGVLKSGSIKFIPELPAYKREAIDRLGFGVYDKVFVEFASSIEENDGGFWPTGAHSVLIVPSAEDDVLEYKKIVNPRNEYNHLADFEPLPYDERDPAHIGIEMVNLSPLSEKKKLVMLIYGQAAEEMESFADTESRLIGFAEEKLHNAFGPNRVPKITHAYATTWGKDEFARGSFANIPIGASGNDMRKLARPVSRRLLFAGEATFPLHYSTVHGALKSGRREFARIMKNFYGVETEHYNLVQEDDNIN